MGTIMASKKIPYSYPLPTTVTMLHSRGGFADLIKLSIQLRKETVLDLLGGLTATTRALCLGQRRRDTKRAGSYIAGLTLEGPRETNSANDLNEPHSRSSPGASS